MAKKFWNFKIKKKEIQDFDMFMKEVSERDGEIRNFMGNGKKFSENGSHLRSRIRIFDHELRKVIKLSLVVQLSPPDSASDTDIEGFNLKKPTKLKKND